MLLYRCGGGVQAVCLCVNQPLHLCAFVGACFCVSLSDHVFQGYDTWILFKWPLGGRPCGPRSPSPLNVVESHLPFLDVKTPWPLLTTEPVLEVVLG